MKIIAKKNNAPIICRFCVFSFRLLFSHDTSDVPSDISICSLSPTKNNLLVIMYEDNYTN